MATQQADKRSRLIQAAVKLVYQQGFHQTTLADLAQEAQVLSLGNVYYYFKTKEALGEALVEQYLRDYRGLCQQWDNDPDPKARLEAFIQMTLDNRQELAQSGCPIGTLCAELHKQGGPLAQQASQIFDELLTWLATQFRALGRGDESADLAVHLLSALEGATLLSHSFRTPSYVVREVNRLKDWIRAL
jgi:TetR/AcrR family transcriptional regulator, transcriptional repressor for nem operon